MSTSWKLVALVLLKLTSLSAVNDVESLTFKTSLHNDAGTLGTITLILWFNYTIYQHSVNGVVKDRTYTAHNSYLPQFNVLDVSECPRSAAQNTSQPQIMIQNSDTNAVYIESVRFDTIYGEWYGIDSVCIDSASIPRGWHTSWRVSDSLCGSGYHRYDQICIDTQSEDCAPSKQMLHFNISLPNQYIHNALWSNAKNVTPITSTCAPTSGPISSPTTSTMNPTKKPTLAPTVSTLNPTLEPTLEPTIHPTVTTTDSPTYNPTMNPTVSWRICLNNVECTYIAEIVFTIEWLAADGFGDNVMDVIIDTIKTQLSSFISIDNMLITASSARDLNSDRENDETVIAAIATDDTESIQILFDDIDESNKMVNEISPKMENAIGAKYTKSSFKIQSMDAEIKVIKPEDWREEEDNDDDGDTNNIQEIVKQFVLTNLGFIVLIAAGLIVCCCLLCTCYCTLICKRNAEKKQQVPPTPAIWYPAGFDVNKHRVDEYSDGDDYDDYDDDYDDDDYDDDATIETHLRDTQHTDQLEMTRSEYTDASSRVDI